MIRDDSTPRGAEDENRAARRIASLVALNQIAALSTAALRERLREALAIGCDLLSLELGIVSEIRGDDYRVVSQVAPGGLSDEQRFSLGQTCCAITIEADDVVSIADMGRSDFRDHPCYAALKIESYIGAPILVRGEVYGTVNFSSAARHPLGFDEGDREFIRLLASWAGAALDREDHLAHLRQAKTDAEAAREAKSRFLSMMSHELRTPLNGILGTAQLLLVSGLDEPTRKRYAQTIARAGTTLLTLLSDLLDLSRLEAGKLNLELSSVTPRALLEECCSLYAAIAEREAIELVWCDGEHGLIGERESSLIGDPTRLRQMLSSLISNAIRHARASRIEVSAEHREVIEVDGRSVAIVEFSVVDDGLGVHPENRARLFQPFSQLDRRAALGGSGLGLALGREFAEAMGGNVGVDSRPGSGSRFWFCVPLEIAASIERPSPVGARSPLVARAGALILVVEDNAVNREILTAMLDLLGYASVCAENGLEALDLLRSADDPPDLVLMDCEMPVMDGYAATREHRRRELARGGPRLPIVALTANVFGEERRRCITAGMDDLLTKPLDLKTLRQTLIEWIARGRHG